MIVAPHWLSSVLLRCPVTVYHFVVGTQKVLPLFHTRIRPAGCNHGSVSIDPPDRKSTLLLGGSKGNGDLLFAFSISQSNSLLHANASPRLIISLPTKIAVHLHQNMIHVVSVNIVNIFPNVGGLHLARCDHAAVINRSQQNDSSLSPKRSNHSMSSPPTWLTVGGPFFYSVGP